MANDFSSDPSCKALWRVENGALTTDSKGTSTLTNTGIVTADITNYMEGGASGLFSGSNYLSIADANLAAGFPFKTGDTTGIGTFCLWFRQGSTNSGNRHLFGKGAWLNKHCFDLDLYNRALYLFTTADGTTQQTILSNVYTFTANRWYHLTLTFDNNLGYYFIYIWDSVSQTVVYTNEGALSGGSVYIGDGIFTLGGLAGASYAGNIDEIVVFNRYLANQEILAIIQGKYPNYVVPANNSFNDELNCEALWKFQGADGHLYDDSKKTNTLVVDYYPGAYFARYGNFLEGNSALKFAYGGAASCMCSVADASLSEGFPFKSGDTGRRMTVCGWFYCTASGSIMEKKNGNYGYRIYREVTSNKLIIIIGDGTTTATYDTGLVLLPSTWFHIAVEIDGITPALYVRLYNIITDAVSEYSTTPLAAVASTSRLSVGYSWELNVTSAVTAHSNQLVVFSRILDVGEIDAIRNGLFGTTPPDACICQTFCPPITSTDPPENCLCATNCEEIPPPYPAPAICQTTCESLPGNGPAANICPTLCQDIPLKNGGLFLVF